MPSVTIILTPAQVNAWAIVPLGLAKPRVSLIPTFVYVRKTEGPAFSISGTPQVGVGHSVAGGYTGLSAAGILDQTAAAKWRNGPNVGSGGYGDVSGQDLTAYVGSGVTGTGSEVVVTIGYEEIPTL